MKEYTIVFTTEITIVGKMPDECTKTPSDFPKEKYEQALKKGVLTAKDFDDLKVTKMQVFDTTRKPALERILEEDAVGLTD